MKRRAIYNTSDQFKVTFLVSERLLRQILENNIHEPRIGTPELFKPTATML